MKQAARWVVRNFPLMVMALFLATLAWFVALEQADPTVERSYRQSIPVSVTNLPEDLLIVGTFQERVQVTVRTTQSLLESVEVDDFQATADVSGLGPGQHQVPVEVTLGAEPSTIVSVDPETVVVQLDSRANRIVPVRVETQGTPAVGYVARPTQLQPRDVTVQGPSGYVTQVVDAFATLSIEGAQADVQDVLSLRPLDGAGNSVSYVSLTPESIDVRVPIEPSGYHSTLAVKAVLTGEVASGYRVTDISIDPPTVTVFGDPADLGALEEGFIETRPVNVEDAQQDVVVRPGLNVPPQVSVVPGQQVQVRVSVDAIQSSVTITSTLEIQGLEPGYSVTLSPDVVEVVLNGPLPRLESLLPDDVRVVLEVFDLPTGTYQIEPEVIVPEALTAQSIIPTTIQVRIAEAPPATAVPSATITSTVTATITSTTTITGQ